MNTRSLLPLLAAAMLWPFSQRAHAGITFAEIHGFQQYETGDGYEPQSALVQHSNGYLYGTTRRGGADSEGAVFGVSTDGTLFASLASFDIDNGGFLGETPISGLTQGPDGNLYGTTEKGGADLAGEVFQYSKSGLIVLYSFTGGDDGAGPYAGLLQGLDGNLYGTTTTGGFWTFLDPHNTGYGTVFRITATGTLNTLYSFNGSDGSDPCGNLVQGKDGGLYGTTQYGGAYGFGTVFKITTNGLFGRLYSFTGVNDGACPRAGLVQGGDGDLYGTTYSDSSGAGFGTVFKITSNGTLTTLASFNNSNGANPNSTLVLATDGNFYGTTDSGLTDYPPITGVIQNWGTVFQMTPAGAITTVVSFDYMDGYGAYPNGLIQASDGSLYGTCQNGGTHFGASGGILFRLGPLIIAPETGSLSVTITPAEAASAGARWQVDSGSWTNSGATVSGLTVGQHTVSCSTVSGWTAPAPFTVSIVANQTTLASPQYLQQQQYGSLQVTIYPQGAVGAGARWQVDGGSWTNSGATVSGLSVGNHTVGFKSISVWSAPGNQTVTISGGSTTTTSGTYTVVLPQVAPPALSPPPGTFSGSVTVHASTTTSGATIRYTTNGNEPTTTSAVFPMAGLKLTTTTTAKAKAFKSGMTDSTTTSGTYTVVLQQVAAPVFNPSPGTFSGSVTVRASTTTSGATIRYTATGSEPTSTSAVFPMAGLKLTGTTSLKAKAFKSGMTDSTTTGGTYTVVLQQVAAPVFNPPPGTSSGSVTVRASTTTSGATIRYTTNGSEPTSTSAVFPVAGLKLTSTTAVKATAFKSGMTDSTVATGTYTIGIPPGPANDNFANRTSIASSGGTVTGSNVGATKEQGEPSHAGNPGGKSVWWTWTPSASGSATITTAGSSFNTLLAIYTGNSVSHLTLVPNGSNDNFGGATTSQVTINVTAGTAYQIAVDGYNGASGSIILAVSGPGAGAIYNTAFLTDAALQDSTSMNDVQIRAFLASHNSYFSQTILDVDGVSFDAASVIAAACSAYLINPEVLLATLEKESLGVTRTTRPSDTTMKNLMGVVPGSTARGQLHDAARLFRSYQDEQDAGGTTRSGWRVGLAKSTSDGLLVTPATKAVAGQFTYTPYAGYQWGGDDPQWGGVYLFYYYWTQFGFGSHPKIMVAAHINALPEFTISSQTLVDHSFSVSISTVLGANYTLEFRNSFADGNWTLAQTLPGTGGTIRLTDGSATNAMRLYRVRAR